MAWVGTKVKVALVVLALVGLVFLANALNGQLKPNEDWSTRGVHSHYELRVCGAEPCTDPPPVDPARRPHSHVLALAVLTATPLRCALAGRPLLSNAPSVPIAVEPPSAARWRRGSADLHGLR